MIRSAKRSESTITRSRTIAMNGYEGEKHLESGSLVRVHHDAFMIPEEDPYWRCVSKVYNCEIAI